MFSSIAERIVIQLESNNAFKSEDRAIYKYGIQQGLSILLNLTTTLSIGIVTGMFWESIVFLAAYVLIRRYAGGFHAKTPVRCYIYSSVMILISLLAIKYLIHSIITSIIIATIGSISICLFAPVEDRNKPLDDKEKTIYRKKTIIYFLIEMLFNITMMINDFYIIYKPICMSLFCIGLLVFMGKIKNRDNLISL